MNPDALIKTIHSFKSFFVGYLTNKEVVELEEFAYTGFISTDLVLILEILALKEITSVDAALIYSLEPVLGAILAYLFLGERWTTMGWLGALVILGSSVFV